MNVLGVKKQLGGSWLEIVIIDFKIIIKVENKKLKECLILGMVLK